MRGVALLGCLTKLFDAVSQRAFALAVQSVEFAQFTDWRGELNILPRAKDDVSAAVRDFEIIGQSALEFTRTTPHRIGLFLYGCVRRRRRSLRTGDPLPQLPLLVADSCQLLADRRHPPLGFCDPLNRLSIQVSAPFRMLQTPSKLALPLQRQFDIARGISGLR